MRVLPDRLLRRENPVCEMHRGIRQKSLTNRAKDGAEQMFRPHVAKPHNPSATRHMILRSLRGINVGERFAKIAKFKLEIFLEKPFWNTALTNESQARVGSHQV